MLISTISTHFGSNFARYIFTFSLLVAFAIIRFVVLRYIKKHANSNQLTKSRVIYVRKFTSMLLSFLFLLVVGFVWEVSLKGISIYLASIFTVVGVALFATWSILSNVTASLILFFFYPYRIGEHIRIQDGDNSIEGEIRDITLFYMKIKVGEEVFTYPNNLVIQKPIKRL